MNLKRILYYTGLILAILSSYLVYQSQVYQAVDEQKTLKTIEEF